ncbi:unnamed protein product [Ascophyllum nodosum]
MFFGWVIPVPYELNAVRLPMLPCVKRSRQHSLGAATEDNVHVSGDHHDDHGCSPLLARGPFLHSMASCVTSAATCSIAVGIHPSIVHSMDAQRDPRTARPPPPALLLPVEKIRLSVVRVIELLEEPSRWEEAISLLQTPPLSSPEFAKTLDRYSDSNWEKHILGDLYRNQGLESIKALEELTAFVLKQRADGVAVTEEDVQDVRDAGRALLASVDDFLALAPPDDRRLVEKLVKGSPALPR